jgi:hypothetical protein
LGIGGGSNVFCLARTDGRCQVAVFAVFTVSSATRAARKRHRVAVAAGLALVVEITETQRGAAGVLNDIGDVPVIRGLEGHFR